MDGEHYAHSAKGEAILSGNRLPPQARGIAHTARHHPDCPGFLPIGALDAAPQPIAITNAAPRRLIVFANRAFCRLTGYAREEMLGQEFRMFACPQTEPSTTARMRAAVRDGRSVTAEVTCRRKDSSRYRIRTHLCPIADPHSGAVTHWISFQKDITGEDEAVSRLEETTERLEATLAATGDGVWDWDIDTGALYWSDRCLEMLGRKRAEFPARMESFLELIHPADTARMALAIRKHLLHGRAFAQDLRLLHADGHPVEVTCKGRATWDHTGTARRMVGTIADVSELANTNRLLKRTESMARIGNWDLSMQSGAMRWSPELYRMLGLDPATTPAALLPLLNRLHPEDRPRLQDALDTGAPFMLEARLSNADGSESHVQLAGDGMRDHTGRLLGVYGMVQDITQRKMQEGIVQHARKMEAFGQMAGGVAHDFNNLLAVIMGNLELLRDTAAPLPDAQGLIGDALRAVARGRELTDSLLNFTHKAVLQPRRVDVNATLTDARRIMEGSLPPNIALHQHCDPAVDWLTVDPGCLKTCLLGLMMNARDAMVAGGTIVLQSRRIVALSGDTRLLSQDGGGALPAGGYVELRVSDDGPGIPPEHLERIFEPFFTTKTVGKGSGLGLSRVRGFAEQSGGTVRVESIPGAGTTVAIILPDR